MASELKEVAIMVCDEWIGREGKEVDCDNPIELREGDMLKFGYSTRSYVLMNENSVDSVDPVGDEHEVHSDQDELNKMV